MRLLPKLTLGTLAAAAVPLAIAGAMWARLSARALSDRIQGDHAALATGAADSVERFLHAETSALAIYPQLVDLSVAAPEVRTGVLRLAYRSGEDVAIVALLDENGRERVGSVYLSDPASARELGDRLVVSDAERDAFLARVPLAAALKDGVAVGEVVSTGSPPGPRCAVAIAFTGVGQKSVLAADLSLSRLEGRLAALSAAGATVAVVDDHRRAVVGAPPGSLVALPRDRDPAGPLPERASVATVAAAGGDLLEAFAPVAGSRLGVVVSQPAEAAFAHVRGLMVRTFFWLGVAALIALIVAVGFARDVSRRIGHLSAGTVVLAGGRFDSRLDEGSTDELGDLARSFNRMAADLGRATDEIKTWNAELERRVEEKTRELKQAQDLLLRARALAAMGTLGAGVAHEINNPLTGVLGAAQLLLMEAPEQSTMRPLLKDVEGQALRIREIVANLLRVTQKEVGDELVPVDLNQIVEDAVDLIGSAELKEARIELERRLAPLPLVRGNPLRLQEAIIELMTNARRAMPTGGTLSISTETPDQRVVLLKVADSGKGIKPEILDKIFDPFFTTKENWTSTGMGLTLVHKIVEEHHGSIKVASEVGQGATFTLTFPSDSGRAHLP